MPKAYFEPENLRALEDVLTEARRRLNSLNVNDPAQLDFIAARILHLAADGMPPYMILREIAPDMGEAPATNDAARPDCGSGSVDDAEAAV